jgi:hypothetical protein
MQDLPKNAVLIAVALSGVLGSSPARAQSSEGEMPVRITPGWVFTPTVAIGVTHDDNPVLAGRGDPSPDDLLTNVRPGVDLTFTAKHLVLSSGYRGAVQRYRTLDEYDSYDQGGYVEFRHQPSKRVSVFAGDTFSVSPTSDIVDVAGLPFTRTGTRTNNFTSGVTVSVAKALQLTGTYGFQWLEFDRTDAEPSPFLQGGSAHNITIGGRQALSSRLKVGADYTIQRATVGQALELRDFTIQNAEAVVSYQLSPTVSIEGGGGISRVELPGEGGARTGPAGHFSLVKRTEYARFSVSTMRSFVPAFGFGGSLRNQDVRGGVRVPFARNRAYVDGGITWRKSDPVLREELGITAVWMDTSVGYSFQRWLKLEAFYNGGFQETTVVGGRVDRNRIGVQVVTSHPMRLN